jgi:aspartate aminotransferase
MTGWRLGYGVMEKKLAQHIARLMTNCNSCTCSFTQIAGMEALTGPQDDAKKMVAEFKKRRDVIVKGLNAIEGISCKLPKGAFYAFPNVKKLTSNAHEFARKLLDEKGVASLSGTAFGSYGEGYLRFSYANSVENIQTALGLVSEFVGSMKKEPSHG